jgi:hypothetical protein
MHEILVGVGEVGSSPKPRWGHLIRESFGHNCGSSVRRLCQPCYSGLICLVAWVPLDIRPFHSVNNLGWDGLDDISKLGSGIVGAFIFDIQLVLQIFPAQPDGVCDILKLEKRGVLSASDVRHFGQKVEEEIDGSSIGA